MSRSDVDGDGTLDHWEPGGELYEAKYGRPLSPYEGMQEGVSMDYYTGDNNPSFGLIPWGTAPEEHSYYDFPIGPEPQFGEEYMYDDDPYADEWAYGLADPLPHGFGPIPAWIQDEMNAWPVGDDLGSNSQITPSLGTDISYDSNVSDVAEDQWIVPYVPPPSYIDPAYQDIYNGATAPYEFDPTSQDYPPLVPYGEDGPEADDYSGLTDSYDTSMDDPTSPSSAMGLGAGLLLGKHKKDGCCCGTYCNWRLRPSCWQNRSSPQFK